MRIKAEVYAVIVDDQEVSAFTKYRTMKHIHSKNPNPFDCNESQMNSEREKYLQQIFQNYPASKLSLPKQRFPYWFQYLYR